MDFQVDECDHVFAMIDMLVRLYDLPESQGLYYKTQWKTGWCCVGQVLTSFTLFRNSCRAPLLPEVGE